MKRPPILPDPSAPSRGRRHLSEEERTLWERVARQFKPLRKKRRAVKTAASMPEPAAATPVASPSRPVPPVSVPGPSKPVVPPLAPLGRRERSRLSKGRSEIDARLDLHGMTQTRAHGRLLAFLQRAHHDGLTFVLVITGKGVAGDTERGVLRRQVPQWLALPEFRTLVVGFEEAHIGHGGGGALYVRIRRARA
jgi:DNA-nicking Smr family endonuclease